MTDREKVTQPAEFDSAEDYVLGRLSAMLKPEAIQRVLDNPVQDLGGMSLRQTIDTNPELAVEIVDEMFDFDQANGS